MVTNSNPLDYPKHAAIASSKRDQPITERPATEPATEIEAGLDPALLQEVDVRTEQAGGRQRKISAQIQIPHSVEQIWQILTDYETLADFIPNLAKSQRIEHPSGGIRLEQVGSQCLLNFHFCARVVLDMVETFPNLIEFRMVEGDFKTFEGQWRLQPAIDSCDTTDLTYTVVVCPPRLMPANIIERRLNQNLRVNLVSIHQRAYQLFGS
ncbi:MAG: SRPBCC family protein [Elainellaceae cyanobacterium]